MAVQSLQFHKDQKMPIAYKLNNSHYFQITPRQKELVKYIKEQPAGTAQYSKIKKDLGVSFSVVKSLEKKGVLSQDVENKSKQEKMFHEPIILSPEQSQAASQIREKYVENEFQSWLLYGVTCLLYTSPSPRDS